MTLCTPFDMCNGIHYSNKSIINSAFSCFTVTVMNLLSFISVDSTVPMNNHANVALYFAAVVVIITAAARLLLVELVQCLKTRYRYFLKIENYIELLAYISSIIFVSHFGTNCWCPTNWQWQLGAFGVFLAWINLILFLKRVPLLGIYVLMFNAILHTFLKFALIAFLFVVAFGIAFYMILYKAVSMSGVRALCACSLGLITQLSSVLYMYIYCVLHQSTNTVTIY